MIIKNELISVDNDEFEEVENESFWRDVKVIASQAFSNCKTNILTIPQGVQKIKSDAFLNNEHLKEVALPYSVTKLGEGVFKNCSELTTAKLDCKVKHIPQEMFSDCNKLSRVFLPKKCKTLAASVFRNCVELDYAFLPNSLEEIGDNCFRNCQKLKFVKMSESLQRIGIGAFRGCTNLIEFEIPYYVDEVLSQTFYDCTNLSAVYVPNTVDVWGEEVFKNCPLRFVCVNDDNSFVFSKKPLHAKKIYDLRKCYDSFYDFDFTGEMFHAPIPGDPSFLETYIQVADLATKNKIKLTTDFVDALKDNNQFDAFINSNLRNFNKVQKLLTGDIDPKDMTALLIFAYDIGCFSNNKNLAQRSVEWLKERIAKNDLQINQFSQLFNEWTPNGENEEFSTFLFSRNPNTNVSVFEEIKQELNHQDLLKRIYDEYLDQDKFLKCGGRFRNEEGKLRFANLKTRKKENGEEVGKRVDHVPTVALFKAYFEAVPFEDIQTPKDFEIASELLKWGNMRQRDFEKGKIIMNRFENSLMAGVLTTNIVGTHLTNFEERLKKYDEQTSKLASDGYAAARDIAVENCVVQDKFTYDWLEKGSAENLRLVQCFWTEIQMTNMTNFCYNLNKGEYHEAKKKIYAAAKTANCSFGPR